MWKWLTGSMSSTGGGGQSYVIPMPSVHQSLELGHIRVAVMQETESKTGLVLYDSHRKSGGARVAATAVRTVGSPSPSLPGNLYEVLFGAMPFKHEGAEAKLHFLEEGHVLLTRVRTRDVQDLSVSSPASLLSGDLSRLVRGSSTSQPGSPLPTAPYRMSFAVCVVVDVSPAPVELVEFLRTTYPVLSRRLDTLADRVGSMLRQYCTTSRDATASVVRNFNFAEDERLLSAVQHFRGGFLAFAQGPRLCRSLWADRLSPSETVREEAAETLLGLLRRLRTLDGKDGVTAFVPAVLSAVLSNHLAWVELVDRVVPVPKNANRDAVHTQYRQLCGMISGRAGPVRLVVTGPDRAVVHQLLLLCSYFVRFSVIAGALTDFVPFSGLLPLEEWISALPPPPSRCTPTEVPLVLMTRKSEGSAASSSSSPPAFLPNQLYKSMLGATQDRFHSDFVLQGLSVPCGVDELGALLRQECEASCYVQGATVMADVARRTVQVVSYHAQGYDRVFGRPIPGVEPATLFVQDVAAPESLVDLLHSTLRMRDAGAPPAVCLRHIENALEAQLLRVARLRALLVLSPSSGIRLTTLATRSNLSIPHLVFLLKIACLGDSTLLSKVLI